MVPGGGPPLPPACAGAGCGISPRGAGGEGKWRLRAGLRRGWRCAARMRAPPGWASGPPGGSSDSDKSPRATTSWMSSLSPTSSCRWSPSVQARGRIRLGSAAPRSSADRGRASPAPVGRHPGLGERRLATGSRDERQRLRVRRVRVRPHRDRRPTAASNASAPVAALVAAAPRASSARPSDGPERQPNVWPDLGEGSLAGLAQAQPVWSVIQQPVAHGPDHNLLFRVNSQLDLNVVHGVSDGHRLDSPCLCDRDV